MHSGRRPYIQETPHALVAAVEEEIRSIGASRARQVKALERLHELFTSGRSRMRSVSYLDDPALRNAYLRYHLPLNAVRGTFVLGQILEVHPSVGALTEVVDLGAGPGSASLASLLSLPGDMPRKYLLHDRSRAGLALARRLLARCTEGSPTDSGSVKISTRVGSLPRLPRIPRQALVWLSMVVNELEAASRRGFDTEVFLGHLAKAVEPPSVVIIVEPALRSPGRDLLRLHDLALRSGAWRVLAPCTHQASCPLLSGRDRSWCHFHFRWKAPPFVREVADPLGLDHAQPSVAYLALERLVGPSRGEAHTGKRARVIGDLMPIAGGRRGVYICRDGRRELLESAPGDTRRGDVIEVPERKGASQRGRGGQPPGRHRRRGR
jgi:ribosomal protein RSM22 (predicted rRNA methylase)